MSNVPEFIQDLPGQANVNLEPEMRIPRYITELHYVLDAGIQAALPC